MIIIKLSGTISRFFNGEGCVMITSTLAVLLFLASLFVIFVAISLLLKITRVNPEEFAEMRRLQGRGGNVFKGELQNPPKNHGDYRIVRGLKWDSKAKKYISQSALSSEGLRAAFPK